MSEEKKGIKIYCGWENEGKQEFCPYISETQSPGERDRYGLRKRCSSLACSNYCKRYFVDNGYDEEKGNYVICGYEQKHQMITTGDTLKKNIEHLTSEESEVLEYLTDAWNSYIRLPVQHHSDKKEFQEAIHRAQQLIALRIARKVLPEVFPVKISKDNQNEQTNNQD
jgi:hypothetical protein